MSDDSIYEDLVDPEALRFAKRTWELRSETFFKSKWLGVPAFQNPFDAWIIQEIIWETRPDVIVETGTFAGGGAALWASLLATAGEGRVITIDVQSNTQARVRDLPIVKERVSFVEGSSTDPALVSRIASETEGERVMVILDSDHSGEHVANELDLWSPLVAPGCYLVVQDGLAGWTLGPDARPGPLEATLAWLPDHPEFEADRARERFLFTFCPSGFLVRRT
jgi:cephalosporin hydroxylase